MDQLIKEGLICINEISFTELAPLLQKPKEKFGLEDLAAIERKPLKLDWEFIRKYP